jgi:hypothetical protein
MRRLLLIAAASTLFCSQANAQMAVTPTPSLSATTPLGMVPSAPVGGTGIPLGATEIASPGISPAPFTPTGTFGTTGCSTVGTASAAMFGSMATFDGGGAAVGIVAPAGTTSAMPMPGGGMAQATTSGIPATSDAIDTSGMSAMCGSGSGNLAASSMPTAPGGVGRTGIPLGSTEIGNLGVSSAAAVPTPGVAPTINAAVASPVPMVPVVTAPPALLSGDPTTSTGALQLTAPSGVPSLQAQGNLVQ